MASSSTDIIKSQKYSPFEIKRFDSKGFDIREDKMQGMLFLKDCDVSQIV